MERRDFIKLCSGTVAVVCARPELLLANDLSVQKHNRVLLTTKAGKPLKASSLKTTDSYLFHYPYVSTPCFLINLGKTVKGLTISSNDEQSANANYQWQGGVGKQQSVVAFSAICTHQLSYPGNKISFISYNLEKTKTADHPQSIVCCAHQTVFDPSQGGTALAGATKVPLISVVLEYDSASDHLYAVGTVGKDIFSEFFRAYKSELNEQFGRGKAKEKVAEKTTVQLHEEFSAQIARC